MKKIILFTIILLLNISCKDTIQNTIQSNDYEEGIYNRSEWNNAKYVE